MHKQKSKSYQLVKLFDGQDALLMRNRIGLSQRDVAKIAGIQQSKISRFESLEQTLSFEDYFKLFAALGVVFRFKILSLHAIGKNYNQKYVGMLEQEND